MNIDQVNEGLEIYGRTLSTFLNQHNLPREWFERPDHFAVKCANRADYQDTCQTLAGRVYARKFFELQQGGRLLASGNLTGSVSLAGFGFQMVEVMQPRPGKETEEGYVEHTEFTFPDFATVMDVLDSRGVDFELQSNPGHGWVNVPISDGLLELKINDRSLGQVVTKELSQGLLTERVY